MESPLDLYRASREELIALIAAAAGADRRAGAARWSATRRSWPRCGRPSRQLSERVGVLLAAVEPPPGDEPSGHPTTMPGLEPAQPRVQPRGAATTAQTPGPRVRAAADAADRPPGACLCPLPPLPHALAGRDPPAPPGGHRAGAGPGGGDRASSIWSGAVPRCGGRWQPGPELAGWWSGRDGWGWGCSA